jgi:hypothetical protein
MESILKSEIFFFVATIALVLVSLIFFVMLAYAVRIVKNVRDISEIAKREAQLLSEDLNNFRTKVKNEGSLWAGAKTFWGALFKNRKGRK